MTFASFPQATTHYKFEVNAWTIKGPGPRRVATIQSGVEPVLPSPPSKLAVTNIEAFSVVLQFTPGFDGNSSITKWTVEVQNCSDQESILCKFFIVLTCYQMEHNVFNRFILL